MKPIVLMLNYARSGGTLLNKCLASLPGVLMLSEVNPLGGGSGATPGINTSTIKDQVKVWHNIDIKSGSFKEQVQQIYDYCESKNMYLIIRDWSYVNFAEFEKYNNNTPPYKFLILDELKEFDLKIFGFVRDSVDVWLSTGYKDVDGFYKNYSKYTEELLKLNCPVYKYEDFVKSPKEEFRKICNIAGIPYYDVFNKCLSYDKLNGDVQNKNKSRGIKQGEIKLLPRKKIISEKISEINKCKTMKEVNSKFGYPTSYYNSFLKDNIVVPGKNMIKKLFFK